MSACSWCCSWAAPEGTHGLFPVLSTPPQVPVSSPHHPSSVLEIFLISRGSLRHSRLQRVKAGLMFFQDQSIAAAQHKPTLWSSTAPDSVRHSEWIPKSQTGLGWKGSFSSSPLPQTGTFFTIPGIPVQLKPGHFQGWSISGCAIFLLFYYNCNSSI